MKHDRTEQLEILSANYVMIRKHGTGFAVHDATPNHFKFIGFYQRYGNAINAGERHLAKNQRNKDTTEHRDLYTCITCGKGYGSISDMAFINFTDENHVCQKCHKESI